MRVPTDNEEWLIETGHKIIEKKAKQGALSLTPPERLIYCLWVADYGMRNAGDLETARDLYKNFRTEGRQLAAELRLPFFLETFSLPTTELEREYFARFDRLCDEIRCA